MHRQELGFIANYFEPNTDGTGVKNILIINQSSLNSGTSASRDSVISQQTEEIKSLKTLLLKWRDSEASTRYL